MKRLLTTAAALGLTATLAACGGQADTETAEAPAAAHNMDEMDMTSAHGIAIQSSGTVTAVDQAAGTVTIDHAPIPEANWPAMVMGFKASPAVTQGVAAGDKVSFDLKLENGGGEVTAIRKQ